MYNINLQHHAIHNQRNGNQINEQINIKPSKNSQLDSMILDQDKLITIIMMMMIMIMMMTIIVFIH